MRYLIWTLLLLSACDPEGQQSFGQALAVHIIDIVVVIATPLLLLLVRKLVNVLEDKWGWDLQDKHDALIDSWVEKGIAYAQEQAFKALKDGNDPVPGDAKKVLAVEFIADNLEGVVTLSRDALEKLIEAKLNLKRPVTP